MDPGGARQTDHERSIPAVRSALTPLDSEVSKHRGKRAAATNHDESSQRNCCQCPKFFLPDARYKVDRNLLNRKFRSRS